MRSVELCERALEAFQFAVHLIAATRTDIGLDNEGDAGRHLGNRVGGGFHDGHDFIPFALDSGEHGCRFVGQARFAHDLHGAGDSRGDGALGAGGRGRGDGEGEEHVFSLKRVPEGGGAEMRGVGGGIRRAAMCKRVSEDFWRGFVAGGEGQKRAMEGRRGLWRAEKGYGGPKGAMCERVVKSLGQQMKTCS